MENRNMTILVVGATGATGKLLVEQLLNRGHQVKVIVRSHNGSPEHIKNHDSLSVITASVLDLSDSEMAKHVKGCDAVASCLGHTLSWKGVYGHPRKLVTDTAHRLCNAIKANNPENRTKYVLMNTTGNSNRDIHEPISFGQKCVVGLLRALLPPHVDNEHAADYLRMEIGQHDQQIEWAAVRPDGLIDEVDVSDYEVHPSPTRSAIFNAGKVSRINVANFMADLITDDKIWNKWSGKMPVIYSKDKAVA
jgi:nucleoside-diphosphate-sugar epimerase